MELKESLKDLVFNKSELKQSVYNATKETFELFREQASMWPLTSPTEATLSSR